MRLQLRSLVAAVALLCVSSPFARAADLLFVTLSDNTIVKYDTTGNVGATIQATQATFASTNLNSPQGLAFDSSGNLYAANNTGNTISKFDPSGNFLTRWSMGSITAFPRFIAFQPVAVPEPSTYALAAIATGVMAAIARRRKARMA